MFVTSFLSNKLKFDFFSSFRLSEQIKENKFAPVFWQTRRAEIMKKPFSLTKFYCQFRPFEYIK